MKTAGNLKFKTKIIKKEGFTLIEVIVCIAILSIVSVVIVQMFTVSAKSNNKAYIMDKANALCTETAEHFKADPGFPGADESGFSKAPAVSGTGTVYTRNLDRNFDYMTGPAPASGSVYRLDVTVTTASAISTTAFYYPDAAYEYELKYTPADMTISQTGSAIVVSAGTSSATIDPGKIIFIGGTSTLSGAAITSGNALIPIYLSSGLGAASTVEIRIANKIRTIVNAADGKEYTAVADIYDVSTGAAITVTATEGVTAQQENRINTTEESENVMYTAGIKIMKLADDSVLAENTVKKYWVK